MTALVSGGHHRGALASVRSLGRAKVAVCVASQRTPALSAWSRFATASVVVPNAKTHPKRFARMLSEEVHGRQIQALLATTDEDLWAISKRRELFPENIIRSLPSHAALTKVYDNAKLFELARSLNIPVTESLTLAPGDDFEVLLRAAAKCAFPQIVKPVVSKGELQVATFVAEDIAELRRYFYATPAFKPDAEAPWGCVVEPSPRGRRVGFGCVVSASGLHAEVYREQLHERRAFSGSTTLSKTTKPIVSVRAQSMKILEALDYRGPAMVEWIGAPSGAYLLSGVVPRIWDSVQLAIDAGVDLPLLVHRLYEGERLPNSVVAKPGHSLRWWVGDVERALEKTFSPGRSGGLRGRVSTVVDSLSPRFLGGARGDVFDVKDPLPFAFDVQGAVKAVGRVLKLAEGEKSDDDAV